VLPKSAAFEWGFRRSRAFAAPFGPQPLTHEKTVRIARADWFTTKGQGFLYVEARTTEGAQENPVVTMQLENDSGEGTEFGFALGRHRGERRARLRPEPAGHGREVPRGDNHDPLKTPRAARHAVRVAATTIAANCDARRPRRGLGEAVADLRDRLVLRRLERRVERVRPRRQDRHDGLRIHRDQLSVDAACERAAVA
jgi:hypothetical protein